jgi:hypothetical protein
MLPNIVLVLVLLLVLDISIFEIGSVKEGYSP